MYLKRSNANSNVRYFDATPVIAGADEPRLIVISKQKKKYLFSARIFRCRCEGFRSGISNEEEELVLFNLDTAFINMVTSVNDVAANNGNGLNIYFKFCQYLKWNWILVRLFSPSPAIAFSFQVVFVRARWAVFFVLYKWNSIKRMGNEILLWQFFFSSHCGEEERIFHMIMLRFFRTIFILSYLFMFCLPLFSYLYVVRRYFG